MRTNIDLEDTLVEEAFRLTNVRTKKELVNLALKELIRSRKKLNLLDLSGKIDLREDYDYSQLRSNKNVPN
ncbi:type II toxin-antitoxin system VapB family antitoxin [Geminocystis sp.]|jgi:Arc/MetJ family transcription regulator|uniref:type II toxin-antitoxin system VapB family antitoxin n=1 Tax=Geminocystis sp. TaxID=2664100 RepID=UPI003592F52C